MAGTQNLSVQSGTFVLATLFLGAFAACFYTVVSRLYLSPIAHFPGPKLAALSKAYQFWFDVVKKGKLPWELIRLHEKYGPIVRIGPNEVHVSDPDFYDVLYTGGSKRRDKDVFAVGGFGIPNCHFGTAEHNQHRLRRSVLNPFFSTQAVSKLEPVLRDKVERFSGALSHVHETCEPIDLAVVIMAMTTDIITEYSFAKSYGFLEKPQFAPEWARLMRDGSETSMLFRYFPSLLGAMRALPPWMVRLLDPQMMQLVDLETDQKAQISAVIASHEDPKQSSNRGTIFHELLDSDLPASEKTVPRLAEEAEILIAAGSTTTTHFLKTTIYFILADRTIHQRLKAELIAAIPDLSSIPPTHILEGLPYLNAIFQEGCRLTFGASSRLGRIAPDADLKYQDYIIPRGTSIGMSTYILHRNKDLFPEPDHFDPERWLAPDSGLLEKYVVNFCRGTRSCLGINLAKAEIFLVLAVVFRRFDLELFETDRSDVDLAHDFFVPHARLDSKGVRVVVTNCADH